MSGSLYQYSPSPSVGQLQSSGQAFQGGFASAQEAEANVLEMERRRQAARLAELQEQRAQAAEQRAAALAPLTMKRTAFDIQQGQLNAPLERRIKELQARTVEQTLGERAASTAAIRGMTFPALATPGAAPRPVAGVAVPGATPGLLAPVAVATPTPGPQAATEQTTTVASPPRVAAAGVSPAMVGGGGADTELEVVGQPVYTGRSTGLMTDRELKDIIRASIPGGGGPAVAGMATLSPEARAALVSDARLTIAQRASASPAERAIYSADGVGAPFEAPTAGLMTTPAVPAAAPAAAAAPTAAAPVAAPAAAAPAAAASTAAAPAAPATAANRAAERGESPSIPYILEPLRIEADRRRLTGEYERLQQQYRVAVASRNAAAVAQVVERADQINQELNHLNGMTAISRFRTGDIAPLIGFLHTESRNQLTFEPRSDGTFNLYLDGRLSSQGVTRDQIEASARMQFDARYRQQVEQRQQQAAALALLQAQETIKQEARTSAEAVLAVVKARAEAASPNLDVQRVTDAQGNQFIVVTDKRTGQTVSGARIVQVPGAQGAQPTFTIEPMPVGQR